MGVTAPALPSEVPRELQARAGGMAIEGQGVEEGAREAETLPRMSPAPPTPSHREAVRSWHCSLLSMWPSPRLVAVPGRPETASSALKGAESHAERVIIDSRAPGRPEPVPSIPGHGSEPLTGRGEPSRRGAGEVRGGGRAAVTSAAAQALPKRRTRLPSLEPVQGPREKWVSPPRGVRGVRQRPPRGG